MNSISNCLSISIHNAYHPSLPHKLFTSKSQKYACHLASVKVPKFVKNVQKSAGSFYELRKKKYDIFLKELTLIIVMTKETVGHQ